MVDYRIVGNFKNLADYQNSAAQQGLAQALTMAQIQKAQQLDVDALGEQAFMKAAMGAPLSPQEQAAARYVDAKSGGIMFNPATGEVTQKPRISDKIGLGGAAPAPSTTHAPSPVSSGDGPIRPSMQKFLQPTAGAEPAPAGGVDYLTEISNMTPKAKQKLSESNIESGRKRLDEIVAGASTAGAAKQSAEIMQDVQPELGYTGTGGGTLAALDKALSALGAPNVIKGSPAARETFQAQGVQSWVKATEPLKGALSEKEGAIIQRAVPSLSTTPAGIKRLTDITIKMGERAQQKSQFYEQYFAQNGSLNGADAIWNEYANSNPIITESDVGVINPRRAKFEEKKAASAPKQRLKYNPETGDFE